MYYLLMGFLSLSLTLSSLFAETASPKVVVIGAGIAGLTTTYYLQEEGIDVSLYEARNRVGGRILTAYINDIPIELGGQNISDGGKALHLNRLIDEFELESFHNRIPYIEAYFDGKKLIPIQDLLATRRCDPEKLQEQIEIAASSSQNMQEVLSKLFDESDPLYKILSMKLAAYEGGVVEKLSPLYAETLYYMLLGGLCAAHPADQEERYIDFIALSDGNATLPEKMASFLGSKVHLNKRLTQISKSNENTYTLSFQDGQVVHADILVLAIPCSVFENIIFDDKVIPLDRLRKIQSIQYGTNAKVILPCLSTVKIPIVMNDQVISFLDKNHLLTLYYTGENSYFTQETINYRYNQIQAMINLGYSSTCTSQSPVFAQDKQFVSYHLPVGYSWPNDPYVKGSYAYIAPGQEDLLTKITEEKGEKFKALFAPIDDNLYFVGEHTSLLLEVPGTMEAACESGERIARTIKAQILK